MYICMAVYLVLWVFCLLLRGVKRSAVHQAQVGTCVLLNQHILQHYKWQLEPNSSGR